jgi:hypothetical protein
MISRCQHRHPQVQLHESDEAGGETGELHLPGDSAKRDRDLGGNARERLNRRDMSGTHRRRHFPLPRQIDGGVLAHPDWLDRGAVSRQLEDPGRDGHDCDGQRCRAHPDYGGSGRGFDG